MKHSLSAFAALLALAIQAPSSSSADAPRCATIEHVSAQIRHEAPEVEIRVIVGVHATRLRSGISALVGQRMPDGGSYLIARLPEAQTSYVVRFADGCATHHGRFPDRLLRAWMDGVPA